MNMCCDLEVDVTGQEVFLVDKNILAFSSGRLRKLFRNVAGPAKKLKVIFHDFPGGAECFELVAKFCYNNGSIDIIPSNIFSLHCAANYMEMTEDVHGIQSLIAQTEKFLKVLHYLPWSELVVAMKQCQTVLPFMISSQTLQGFLNSLVCKIAFPNVTTPSSSSSERSGSQFSSDGSPDSVKIHSPETVWWFEDLLFPNSDLLEKIVWTMLAYDLDHATVSSFLFFYWKSRFTGALQSEKSRVTNSVINLLFLLDGSFISFRKLCDVLQLSSSCKISKNCKNKLETLIGSSLHQATLDDLLVASPRPKKYAYDVHLILRLLKAFLVQSSNQSFFHRFKKVAILMDLYIAEVAPDPFLKPHPFVAIAKALPDFARDSYDRIYEAMDLYLEVHGGLCEERKVRICCALNYDKLSAEALRHLAQNLNFPHCATVTALVTLQSKLKSNPKASLVFLSFNVEREAELKLQSQQEHFKKSKKLDFPAGKMRSLEDTLQKPWNQECLVRSVYH